MTSIIAQINQMQSDANKMQAAETAENGATKELDQNAFLMLMMEQLKYQDPLEPTGNTEFLAQQAQFTQVSELQKMNDAMNSLTSSLTEFATSMNANNEVVQASTMIGKEVSVTNPDDKTQTITGKVSSVNFSNGYAALEINGKEYPMSYVYKITGEE